MKKSKKELEAKAQEAVRKASEAVKAANEALAEANTALQVMQALSDVELDRIAGKFYRGRDWADSREEGSGLGLYIASTLMEKMDGELVPASGGPGKGLTITLMIPLS